MHLNRLRRGQRGRIKRVRGRGKMFQKFLDMGIVAGSEILMVREAPLFDPIEIKIQGYSISIRKDEAGQIEIEEI